MFGEIDPEALQNRSLLVSLFVDQAAPDIKKYFNQCSPAWQGKLIGEIVSIAMFVYYGRNEAKARQKTAGRGG